jgi:hypothetical protein
MYVSCTEHTLMHIMNEQKDYTVCGVHDDMNMNDQLSSDM